MTDDKRGQGDQRPSPPDAPHRRTATAMMVALAALIAAALCLYFVRSIALPFVLAGALAYVCTPLINALSRRTRAPRWAFAVALWLALLALAALIGYLAIPLLSREIARLATNPQAHIAALLQALIGARSIHLFGSSIDATQLAASAAGALHDWLSAGGGTRQLAAWAGDAVFVFILSWVLLGYFLLDGARIAAGLLWLVPPARRAFVVQVARRLDPVLRHYFVGVALVVVYASSAAWIGLGLILGLRHALLLALLTGMLEILPVLGPAASAIIGALAATRQAASGWSIVAYALYVIGLRLSIDQVFAPLVLGRAAHVRPVLVIFCFLAGGVLFGIAGIILAVPVALTIKVVLATLYGEPDPHAMPAGKSRRGWLAHAVYALDGCLRRRQGIFEYSADARCLFRIERAASERGFVLADGTQVRVGDPILKLHLWNEHVPAEARRGPTLGWARAMTRALDNSLRELACYLLQHPDFDAVEAICADMRLGAADRGAQLRRIVARYGFEAAADRAAGRPRPLHRIGENILMALLVLACNPAALRRRFFRRDHQRVLLSRSVLEQRYGIVAPRCCVAND